MVKLSAFRAGRPPTRPRPFLRPELRDDLAWVIICARGYPITLKVKTANQNTNLRNYFTNLRGQAPVAAVIATEDANSRVGREAGKAGRLNFDLDSLCPSGCERIITMMFNHIEGDGPPNENNRGLFTRQDPEN